MAYNNFYHVKKINVSSYKFWEFIRISELLPKKRKNEFWMLKIGLFLQKLFYNFHENFFSNNRITFAIIGRGFHHSSFIFSIFFSLLLFSSYFFKFLSWPLNRLHNLDMNLCFVVDLSKNYAANSDICRLFHAVLRVARPLVFVCKLKFDFFQFLIHLLSYLKNLNMISRFVFELLKKHTSNSDIFRYFLLDFPDWAPPSAPGVSGKFLDTIFEFNELIWSLF